MRLQKILSAAGLCSRRKAEFYIENGFVSVNGYLVRELGSKADPNIDLIYFDGVKLEPFVNMIYLALNKPKGYVSSCSQKGQKIVTDLINLPDRLFPVGRLDKDSEGLILMTNDGRLHHRLLHPSFSHEKEYYVDTLKPVSSKFIVSMGKSFVLDGKVTRPARVTGLSKYKFKIVLKEGKNRQIRKMVNLLQNKVLVLKRVRIENINLGFLKKGSWRYLDHKEKRGLKRLLKRS